MDKIDVSQLKVSFLDQLNLLANPKLGKEVKDKAKSQFNPSEIPDIFRQMYNVATSLGSKEALFEMQVRISERLGNEKISDPLLSRQMLDIFNQRREYYIQAMTSLLILSINSQADTKSVVSHPNP